MSNTDTSLLDPTPSGAQQYGFAPPKPASDQATAQPPPQMSDADIQKMVQQRQAITDKSIADIDALDKRRMALASQPTPHPAHPQLGDIPKPPDTKPLNVFKEGQAPLIFATVFGAAMMKNHGMGAMAAATGFLEGWQKGDQERMDRERQKWNDSVDAIIKENGVQKERYDMALNDTRLSQADKAAQISAISASLNDTVVKNSIAVGNLDFAHNVIEKRNEAAQKLYENQLRFGDLGGMSNDAVEIAAQQALEKGGVLPASMFRGSQGPRDRQRVWNRLTELAKERNISGADLAAMEQKFKADTAGLSSAERKIGSISGGLDVIMRNAYAAIPQALDASKKVPRGKFVPINQLVQSSDAKLSDPNLISFKQANLQLAELWARAMNPQGVMRESDRELALSILSTATSQEAYERVVNNLKTFLEREQKSVTQAREGIPMTQQSLEPGPNGPAAIPEGWSIKPVQ